VSLQDKPDAALADLRPGQKVELCYESAQGVPVAHQIAQENAVFIGVVNAIDPSNHVMTVREHMLDKTFQIADDCRVVLRDEKPGWIADVRPGYRVTVTYEIPNGIATARRIAQTSRTFSGTLTAIDLNEHTLKAKTLLDTKTFHVADGCAVSLNGRLDSKLRDLKLDDRFVFSYDVVSGVNIVNRITTPEAPPATTTAAAGRLREPGVPVPPTY
jgi:hypothetical protein